MKKLMTQVTMVAVVLAFAGCAAFRASVKETTPTDAKTVTAKYDQKDYLSWTAEIAKLITAAPFPPEGESRPILAVFPIQNRTKNHLDTQALAENIATRMFDAGTIQMANTQQRDTLIKEQGYQLANVTPETRVAIGKQLGAKYMLSGAIVEIGQESGRQVRVSKTQDVYYQLTVDITDLQTGLIVVRKQVERMRQERKPIIGW